MIDATQLVQEEAGSVSQEFSEGGEGAEGLKVVDIAILAFLGVKVVIPIVCSFAGRELWERYDSIRSRSQAKKAEEELAGRRLGEAKVEPEKVIAPIVESLLEEGVSAEQAALIAGKTYRRISDRVTTAG